MNAKVWWGRGCSDADGLFTPDQGKDTSGGTSGDVTAGEEFIQGRGHPSFAGQQADDVLIEAVRLRFAQDAVHMVARRLLGRLACPLDAVYVAVHLPDGGRWGVGCGNAVIADGLQSHDENLSLGDAGWNAGLSVWPDHRRLACDRVDNAIQMP